MTTTDLLAGFAILVGVLGIVIPILPGTLLILVAVLVWAAAVGSGTAWAAAGVAATVLVVGAVAKYALPGKRLQAAGVPTSTIVVGGVAGIIGFFVIPVVGLFLGFVAGVYVVELQRVGQSRAWPSTWAAVKATGLSLLIELAAGLVAATAWLVGVLLVR